MSPDRTDDQLLREFAQRCSEDAFHQLAQRHLDMVFATAFRATSDHTAAEEITQNVFIALAKKSAWLQRESSLASWLHRAALMESRQWWRAELRRRTREQTAIELESIMKTSPEEAPALAGVLDEALLELREGERQAILLRYFEGLNHREIGIALRIGEDAARKRVDRGMEQLLAYFRKRGFAVGSTAAVAGAISASAHAAPSGLAISAAQAALSAGSAVPPLLARVLGVGKMQVAGLSLMLLMIPALWQQAQLHSARGEQRRLAALLSRMESERSEVTNELFNAEAQIARLTAAEESAQAKQDSMAASVGAEDADSRLYLWNESTDYVRVPKAALERIAFSRSQTFDKVQSRVSGVVLNVLGLAPDEQNAVQEIFSRHFNAYGDWIDANGYPARFDQVETNLPRALVGIRNMVSIDEDTRVWVTPSVSGEGWRTQFQKELAIVTGEERAGIILRMARDDSSLADCFQRFGARDSYLVIAPDPSGGFWMVTHSQVSSLKTPGKFSEVLNPWQEEKFDEAAVRREIIEGIREGRKEHPEIRDEDVPPMEEMLEEAREEWTIQQAQSRGNIYRELGRPLPKPVIDYLRDWLARHPGTPDAPKGF